MKHLILAVSLFITLKTQAQESKSIYRYAPIGIVSAGLATTVGNAVGNRNTGIACGALASIASSLLVRYRTDSHTALITTASGFACTAALTISLNKRKKKRNSVNCYTF